MEPVASGSQQPVREPRIPASSPVLSPTGSNYLLTLSDQHYDDLINDMGHNGLWNLEVMELAAFIALNLPGWQGVALRIEDQQSNRVLFLPPPSGEASSILVLRQRVNQHEQIFYTPLLSGHFEAMDDVPYGDHFMLALYTARYNLMPDQVSSLEILRFRQSLVETLHHDGNCQHYINRYFHHWAPRPSLVHAPYRGANDEFEILLHQQGYNLIARGSDVQQQVPLIREVLNLFDNSLCNMLTTISQNTSRISLIVARQLGIMPAEVSGEMLELIHQRLTQYYQVCQRYLNEDYNQFLLSLPNEQQLGVDAAAFPDDNQHRIVFTTMNQQASFVKLLQTVPHEISHMMPGVLSTEDMFYLIGYGLPDELRTTLSALNAMREEQHETSSLTGLADLLLSKIYDAIMMKTPTPAGMTRMRFLEVLDKAKGATLDDARWQTFMQHQQPEYGVSPAWLSATRQEVFTDPVWTMIADISGLTYHNPAQLLTELHADKLALLKVILQNADSLVMLVLEYDAEYLAQYTKLNGYQFIRRELSSDSFDTGSSSSLTDEPDYRSLAQPERLTPFQLHHALEDLAQVATTLANTSSAGMSDMLSVSPFIFSYGRRIGSRLGYLAAHRSALPSITSTLYLTTLRKMLVERLLTPLQILRIISPHQRDFRWCLSDAVADRIWQDGKLIVWQQLVSDCLKPLPPVQRQGYLHEFTSSAGGRRFLRHIAHQLPVLVSEGNREVMIALQRMIADGLIPASYQVAMDINRLSSNLPTFPPQPVVSPDIFALLNYVKEFSQVISDEYITRLNDAEMLAGLATQHGWYVVGEDEEGEARYFFDPQGQSILAHPPLLNDNQQVLVVRNNTLNLLQQTADGPREMAQATWQPGNNASLIAAAQQIGGHALAQTPSLLSQQFLRRMSASNTALSPAAQNSQPEGMSALTNTSKIEKNAARINQHLNKYYADMTADNHRITQHGKKAPLRKIKLALSEINASKKRKVGEAELQSISSHVEDIEENLKAMQHFTGVDRRLSYFNALPPHFHSIHQHSSSLRAESGQDKRHKKDLIERHLAQISKSTREGMSYTLKAKGKIHSLSREASEGKPSRYLASLLRHQAPDNSRTTDAAALPGNFAGVFIEGLMAISQPAFSVAHQQDCLMRDRLQQQCWQAERNARDYHLRHAERQIYDVQRLNFQLEQALLERKRRAERVQRQAFIASHHRDAEVIDPPSAQDKTSAARLEAEPEGVTQPLSQQIAPQHELQYSTVATVTPGIAESAGTLLNINSNFSATQLLAPATVTRRSDRPVERNPDWTRRPAYPANSGAANIMHFVDFIRRSHRGAANPQMPLDSLHFSTRRPLRAAAGSDCPPLSQSVRRSRLAAIIPVDPVREAHRDMVVHAQRTSIFSAAAEPTLQRQQLDRLIEARRPAPMMPTRRQSEAEEALRQHRRMVRIAVQREALDRRAQSAKK